MQKTLLIIRGLPGAGKSHLTNKLIALAEKDSIKTFSLEWYLERSEGQLDFPSWAEQMSDDITRTLWAGHPFIILHDVYAQRWQWNDYEQLAIDCGYEVHFLICENRHHGISVHEVPEEQMEKYRQIFEVKL